MMDPPGCSREGGSLLHLDGFGVPDPERVAEEEEEDRRREEEEEERGRAEEIKDLLEGAFDDLEESEWETSGELPVNSFHENDMPSEVSAASQGQTSASPHPGGPAAPHLQDQCTESRDSLQEKRVTELITLAGKREQGIENYGGATEQSDSGSLTPWSENSHDSSHQFLPHQPHLMTNSMGNNLAASIQQSLLHIEHTNTLSQHGDEDFGIPESDGKNLRLQDDEIELSYEHLKLLYIERGRQLDQQMAKLSSLEFEKEENNKVLVQKISLLESEAMNKTASINQLQVHLLEKEEKIVDLLSHINELGDKQNAIETENKRLVSELGNAQSTISGLESMVSELRTADGLTKEQKLQSNITKKLEEENEVLLDKNQTLQMELKTMQENIKKLREELLNKQKLIAKQSQIINVLKNEYEELLSSPGNQQVMQLKQKVENPQASKLVLGSQVSALENEVSNAKAALERCVTNDREKNFSTPEDPNTVATCRKKIEELEFKVRTLREKHHPDAVSKLLPQEEIDILRKEAQEKRDLESECKSYQEKLETLSSIIERQQEVIGDRQQYKNHFVMVQEANMKKQKQDLDQFNNIIGKYKRVFLLFSNELENEQTKVQQKEEEVKKLTDIIQDQDMEVQKLQEENKANQQFLVEQQAELEIQKQKVKKVEEKWKNEMNKVEGELKEVKNKHKTLKVKFSKYHNKMEACVDHYRAENSRIMEEFELVKHKLQVLYRAEVKKLREDCVTGVEEIICHLRGMESVPGHLIYSHLMGMMPELEEFLADLNNFDIVMHTGNDKEDLS